MDEAAKRRSIGFLNIAHAIDHFVLLIYPTVVLGLEVIYQRSYSELISLSMATFVAFGVFSLPAGWLADRWSRRNMMALFYLGCGVSLAGIGLAPNFIVLAIGMFALGMFAAIYHPVGMAMLIEASQARGRTLAFNGVCGNLGVSLAAGISGALTTWLGWRFAFFAPAVLCIMVGAYYLRVTPDDGHHAAHRTSKPAVPLTARTAAAFFSLLLVIALSSGLVFNILTVALPKIVAEDIANTVPLALIGSVATLVLICGALAQLAVGRLVEYFAPHTLFAWITVLGFAGNLWSAYASGIGLLVALAIAIAAIYGQVTVNDMVIARYTADAWRGRIYAVRYFLLFTSSAASVGLIAVLYDKGGFGLVLSVNAILALILLVSTCGFAAMVSIADARHAAAQAQPAE
jgi:MFS family permease